MSRIHKNLKNEIRLAIGERNDVVLWNNESGVAVHPAGQFVRYGVGKGGADLLGLVCMYVNFRNGTERDKPRVFGRFIAIEVKTGRARLDPAQKLFLDLVRRFGGYAAVVRSVEDAIKAIEDCKNGLYGDD